MQNPSKKKVKHPKIDPYVISIKQKHEVPRIIKKFRKEGYIITALEVRAIVKSIGRSRRKVYRFIRENFSQSDSDI